MQKYRDFRAGIKEFCGHQHCFIANVVKSQIYLRSPQIVCIRRLIFANPIEHDGMQNVKEKKKKKITIRLELNEQRNLIKGWLLRNRQNRSVHYFRLSCPPFQQIISERCGNPEKGFEERKNWKNEFYTGRCCVSITQWLWNEYGNLKIESFLMQKSTMYITQYSITITIYWMFLVFSLINYSAFNITLSNIKF